mmetsp:Transcript_21076/g.39466  ORF Transcript_21076/g.39466 Transcript_21076/m.39466 type:complete len:209 (+) Transcript_21076:664-1290(+)
MTDLRSADPFSPTANSFSTSSSISVAMVEPSTVLSSLPSRHAARAVLYVWKFGLTFRLLILLSHSYAKAEFLGSVAHAPMAVVYETTFGSIPAWSIPMMMPSHPIVLPCLARRFMAMLVVMMLPSVLCVFRIDSRTARVRASSPQISQALMTVLNTETGGLSALPSSESLTQSRRSAVDLRLFSLLAQHVTTFLQTLVEGVRDRSGMS